MLLQQIKLSFLICKMKRFFFWEESSHLKELSQTIEKTSTYFSWWRVLWRCKVHLHNGGHHLSASFYIVEIRNGLFISLMLLHKVVQTFEIVLSLFPDLYDLWNANIFPFSISLVWWHFTDWLLDFTWQICASKKGTANILRLPTARTQME